MSQVSETLAEWREGERRLATASDPNEIPSLLAEVEKLHDAYRRAVDLSGDVTAHGGPSDTRDEPNP